MYDMLLISQYPTNVQSVFIYKFPDIGRMF